MRLYSQMRFVVLVVGLPWAVQAEDSVAPPPVHPGEFLMFDSLGKVVATPTNDIPAGLLPPDGLHLQIPTSARGISEPELLRHRLEMGRLKQDGFTWFPAFAPPLAPYFSGIDTFGNSAMLPGPLIDSTPLDVWVQTVKYDLSAYGLKYSLQQTLTFLNMTGETHGEGTLGFYTFKWAGNWTVYSSSGGEEAGWLTWEMEVKNGFGAGRSQSAKKNLGTLTNPSNVWSGRNGFELPQLAWQQSFARGEVVMIAGIVDQGNYLDANAYANSGRGQFLNSALVNSMVLPLSSYNPAITLQWQPTREWYGQLGTSVGNGGPGQMPWDEFSPEYWSMVGEIGYTPDDVLGLGHGVYRVQPFIAQADGPLQGGFGFNFQQRLGTHQPFGVFGRFGVGGSTVVGGASAQIGTGVVMQAPLKYVGLIEGQPNDAFGVAMVWSDPPEVSGQPPARQEWTMEVGYVFHLTPLVRLQPDLQIVWDPAYQTQTDHAVVFQMQMDVSW
ncbi:MAG: carbohydrate porin [Verrucomicrobia bacterium]|nr:carbohydrate porin [Verrucomicrobiota bacterium]